VLADLPHDRLGQGPVSLVERPERLGDVALDLLQLQPHVVDAVEGGRVRDLADRCRRGLHRLARGARGVGEVTDRVLDAGGPRRERLEPLVTRGDQAPDRLVAREQGHDPFLLGPDVFRGRAPELAGDLAHQQRRLLLERLEALLDPLVDGFGQGVRDLLLGGGEDGRFGVLLSGEQGGTPTSTGSRRPCGALFVHDVPRDPGPLRHVSAEG
jgi:hypothetical protein